MTLKTKWYHSYGNCDDSRSCEQLKKRITDKDFERKLCFKSESPSVTEKFITIIIAERLVSTWHIRLTEIPEEKHLRLSNLNKFKVIWLL